VDTALGVMVRDVGARPDTGHSVNAQEVHDLREYSSPQVNV
jgi:hypothetical protein